MTGQKETASMEVNDNDIAEVLMQLKNTPSPAMFVLKAYETIPALDIGVSAVSKSDSLNSSNQPFVLSATRAAKPAGNTLNGLIAELEEQIPLEPVSKVERKPRRGSMMSNSSVSVASTANVVDSFDESLPRLRSQAKSNKRRASVTFGQSRRTKRRGISVDSVRSQPVMLSSPRFGYTSRYKTRSASSVTAREADKSGIIIGKYTLAERKELIARWAAKRKNRVWAKRIRYNVRKTFADSRLRVKGRFISKEDETKLREHLMWLV